MEQKRANEAEERLRLQAQVGREYAASLYQLGTFVDIPIRTNRPLLMLFSADKLCCDLGVKWVKCSECACPFC